MATVGRPKGSSVKYGGRQKGTPNKPDVGISKEAIARCFKRLGGEKWLYDFALSSPEPFIRLVLVRILPPIPSPEPVIQINNQQVVKIDQLSEFEIARRLAFALNKASNALDGSSVITSKTEIIAPGCEAVAAEPVKPLEYPLAEQAKAQSDEALVRNTVDGTYGSAAEQGRRKR